MDNQNFPLDMPIQVYTGDGSTASGTLNAAWRTSLSIGDATVLYQNSSSSYPLGLYYKIPQSSGSFSWSYVVPYSYLSQYVIDGGTVGIYMYLTQAVTVLDGSIVFYKGGGPISPTTIGPGEGPWAIVELNSGGGSISNLGPQQANFVLAGPSNGASATPTFRALTEADTPYAAPIDSPALTGSPTNPNPGWPASYDDPDDQGNYKPGGISEMATRDLVKNVVAGALGNFSSINQFNITPTMLPVAGGSGILWAANFQNAAGSAILPALSAANYPNPVAAVGTTYSFANIGVKPFNLEVGQGGDTFVWGSYAALNQIIVNPGESLQVTFMFWNGNMQWLVSGGTTLPWADNSYSINMNSGQASVVPITAVGKEQIILNGSLIKTFANGVEVPPVLDLPSNGEWTIINLTTGGVTILIANHTISGATIPLVSGCNTHVATGPYGIQTASGSINGGSIELTAYASGGNLNIVPGQLLYDTLLFIDDPNNGNLTANVTYVFDPAILPSMRSGKWTFYNDLQQTTSFTVSVADTQGNSYVVPKGQVVTVLYLPSGKLVQI